jgi:hypothetical protein
VTVEEQHSAFPKLMGAPAYARPPSAIEPAARPFDPDALPILAEQTAEERALLVQLDGSYRTHPGIVVASWPPQWADEGVYGSPTPSIVPERLPPAARPPAGRGASESTTAAVDHRGGAGPAGQPLADRPGAPDVLAVRPFSVRDLTARLRGRR